MAALLNSGPLSVWKTSMSSKGTQRGERGLHQPGVLALAGRVPDDLAVVQVDQQADVAPPGSHAHIGEVADDVGPGRAPVELLVDDVGDVGLACARAAWLELGVGIGADQALALHDADDAAPAEHDAPAGEGRLDLPGPVPSAALLERRRHLLGGGIGRLGRLRPAAHGAAGRSGRAEDLALRRYRVAAGVRRRRRRFRASISAACFKTSFSMRRCLLSLEVGYALLLRGPVVGRPRRFGRVDGVDPPPHGRAAEVVVGHDLADGLAAVAEADYLALEVVGEAPRVVRVRHADSFPSGEPASLMKLSSIV